VAASAQLRSWPPRGLSKTGGRLAEALRMHGPSTRARLGETSGLSRPTVTTALAELTERGFIEATTDASPEGLGRPAELVRLSRNAGLAVGVDIGRRHVQVVLADLGHQEIGKIPAEADAYRHPPSADAHPDEVLDKAALLVLDLLGRSGGTLEQVAAIGLGIPAPITHSGEIGSPTLLPGWAGINPAPALSSRLAGVPVLIDNDANLGALGEYLFGGFRDEHCTAEGYELASGTAGYARVPAEPQANSGIPPLTSTTSRFASAAITGVLSFTPAGKRCSGRPAPDCPNSPTSWTSSTGPKQGIPTV